MPASVAACFWCQNVGAVALNLKDHAAEPKTNSVIWMGVGIVEELGEGVKGFVVLIFFEGHQITNCNHNCVVYSDGAIKESADNGLDVGDFQGREDGAVVLIVSKFLLGAIDRLFPFVG